MNDRIFMATIQRGLGSDLREFEKHIKAVDIFAAAENLKAIYGNRHFKSTVIAIEEVNFAEDDKEISHVHDITRI